MRMRLALTRSRRARRRAISVSTSSSVTATSNSAAREASTSPSTSESIAALERLPGLLVQRLDLLVEDLVARPAGELRLELLELGDELHRDDGLALVHVGAVEARAGDVGDRPRVRLPVAVPCRRAEDADRHGDGDGEADDDQLLRAQLVLPARSVPAIENGSGAECHERWIIGELVMRRLGVRPSSAAGFGRPPC